MISRVIINILTCPTFFPIGLAKFSMWDSYFGHDCFAGWKAFIVGKDFGARPAYQFAISYPNRVCGVITLGIPFSITSFSSAVKSPGFYISRWRVRNSKLWLFLVLLLFSARLNINSMSFKSHRLDFFYSCLLVADDYTGQMRSAHS